MWSYSGNPAASDLDAVRFAIGDTDTADQLLSDEEIAYLLTNSTVSAASIAACEALAAKFARSVDRTVGSLSLSASQKAKQFRELAATLRRQRAVLAAPYAGGISVADKDTQRADTDRVKPTFYRTENRYEYDRYERFG